MNPKALLIPIAALALSATGVSAFNPEVLERAGLTEVQRSAFETAHELRKEGDLDAARDVLKDAGVDIGVIESVRKAMHEHKQAMRSAIDQAIETDDYEAFLAAIADSPLADIITTKEDFELFKEAHQLHENGEHQSAKEIMEELGLGQGMFMRHSFGHMMDHGESFKNN